MVVYVVQQELQYEATDIDGIYELEADAKKAASALDERWGYSDYTVTRFEVL